MNVAAHAPARFNRRAMDAGIVLVLAPIAAAAIAFAHDRTPLCFALLSALAAITTWRWHAPADLRLGATGLVLGTFAEWCATQSGLWRYAYTDLPTLPAWVLLMWWMFPIAVRVLVEAAVGPPPPGSRLRGALYALVIIAWVCAFGVAQPWIALFGTLALMTLQIRRPLAPHLGIVLIASALGPLTEAIPLRLGAWSYSSDALAGFPIWLPAGYGAFALAILAAGGPRPAAERNQDCAR
ncbi:MAG: hypothetical protein AB7Q97_00190 [Gammaproteobacteria bacterium]